MRVRSLQMVWRCATFFALIGIGGTSCKQGGTSSDVSADTHTQATANINSATTFEGKMSQDLKDFRTQFLNMRTAEDVSKLVDEWTIKLTQNKLQHNDIKLLAAQMMPLKSFRGISYKLKNVVENRKSRIVHSLGVSALMELATGTRLFNPVAGQSQEANPWRAIHKYITEPYKGIIKFESIKDLQSELYGQFKLDLSKAIDTVRQISIADDSPVVWDNQIFLGSDKFGSEADLRDRFSLIYESERKGILSGLLTTRHNLGVFVAYDLEDIPEVLQAFQKSIGLDGSLPFEKVEGLSAWDRRVILNKYPNLFHRIRDDSLPSAYDDLHEAVDIAESAWVGIKNQRDKSATFGEFQVFDSQKILPWTRINDTTLSNLKSLLDGNGIHNNVTNKVWKINLKALYGRDGTPPVNLQAFLPTAYNNADADRYLQVDGFADARNYEFGMATSWDPIAYRPYFPDVVNGSEIPALVRDLGLVWGGASLGLPLGLIGMIL